MIAELAASGTDLWLFLLTTILAGYLLGSVPFGLVLSRAAGLGDIRKIGSGSIGATNVLRTGKRSLAFMTLILDGGKGACAVFLGQVLAHSWGVAGTSFWWMALALGLPPVLGHLFPVWLKFRGGKGVATAFGVLLALDWVVALAALALWLGVFLLTRISSASALAACVAAPLLVLALPVPGDPAQLPPGADKSGVALLALALEILILMRHIPNIRRLLQGTEPRFGAKKDPPDDRAAQAS